MQHEVAKNPPTITLKLTPETVRLGGLILSRNQGCEDPFGQENYYKELFKTLLDELIVEGGAAII
jgi:hypothetical protein